MLETILDLLPIGLVIAAILLAITGVFYGLGIRKVRQTRNRWLADGRRIQYGPVGSGVASLRARAHDTYVSLFGVVGLVDGRLEYAGIFGPEINISVPFDDIHWIGLKLVAVRDDPKKNGYQVKVHFEGPDGHHAYTFNTRHWRDFAAALHEHTGLPLHDMGRKGEELYPVQAARMSQNIYGQWQSDFTDKLYLAPDRVLFAWQNPILLDDIRQIEVYDKESPLEAVNPFAKDMLRIDYEVDGTQHTVGFEMSGAQRWAEALADRSGAPLTVHRGRKKKEA